MCCLDQYAYNKLIDLLYASLALFQIDNNAACKLQCSSSLCCIPKSFIPACLLVCDISRFTGYGLIRYLEGYRAADHEVDAGWQL
jgi:hypothetical protein